MKQDLNNKNSGNEKGADTSAGGRIKKLIFYPDRAREIREQDQYLAINGLIGEVERVNDKIKGIYRRLDFIQEQISAARDEIDELKPETPTCPDCSGYGYIQTGPHDEKLCYACGGTGEYHEETGGE